MSAAAREKFVNHKVDLALSLAKGECGGVYSDAVILMSSAVSAVAADLFPGGAKDRKRFIETWVRYADAHLLPQRVSIPLLRQDLLSLGRTTEAVALQELRPKMFGAGYGSKVVTGVDVDASEIEVRSACPSLTVREIRQFAYPSVFYRDVRSPLVHEYHLGDRASQEPMTEKTADVSYLNRGSERLVYYHLDWVADVVRSIAAATNHLAGSLADPAAWWIDG